MKALGWVGFAVCAQLALASPARAQEFLKGDCGRALLSPELEQVTDIPGGGILTSYFRADIDGDGSLDDVTSTDTNIAVRYGGPSPKPTQMLGGPDAMAMHALAAWDLDGAPGAELVVADRSRIQVLKADSAGVLTTFTTAQYPPARVGHAHWIWPGHFRSASRVELLFGNPDSAELSLYELGGDEFVPIAGVEALESVMGPGLGSTTVVTDMDGDGLDDVVFLSLDLKIARLGERSAWEIWQSFTPPPNFSGYEVVAAGDFDGDGRRDLIAQLETFGDDEPVVQTWLQTTAAAFSALTSTAGGMFYTGDRVVAGDLNGDGSDELVGWGRSLRLVGQTWIPSPPLGFSKPLDLSDGDGDGALELTALDEPHVVRTRPAEADLGIVLDEAQSTLHADGMLSAVLELTNHGPTATQGLVVSTDLDSAHVGCTEAEGGCPDLVLAPGQSTTITVTEDGPNPLHDFDVSICSGAPDPAHENDTVHVPLDTDPIANLGTSMAGAFFADWTFATATYVSNDGPSTARDVKLIIAVEPGQPIPEVSSDPATASCTTNQNVVTCTLDALAPFDIWTTSLLGLVYESKPITITSTVTSSTPDPDSSRNQYVYAIPGGLTPTGAIPRETPEPSDGSSNGGCACELGRKQGVSPWFFAIGAAWLLLRRRNRSPTSDTNIPG